MYNKFVNFERLDDKLTSLILTEEWNKLSRTFNGKRNIILFGHGGNMGVCDHGSIDIGRLTDKCTLSPGSAIVCTSLISDFSFKEWLKEWLIINLRGIKPEDTLIIGNSCSVGSASSAAIINGLEYGESVGCSTALISARNKQDLLPGTIKIITDSIYYHTHEVMSLMLIYQLIYSFNNKIPDQDLVDCPPPIKVLISNPVDPGCHNCDYGALDHSFCPPLLDAEIKSVPPGLEKDENNIAIDFDGVLHRFDKGYFDGTCYGEPVTGALDAIKYLSTKYNIIIFSSKCLPDRPLVSGATGRELIIGWLQKHDILKYIKDVTHIKPRAQFYIDDKAIEFKDNWEHVLKTL